MTSRIGTVVASCAKRRLQCKAPRCRSKRTKSLSCAYYTTSACIATALRLVCVTYFWSRFDLDVVHVMFHWAMTGSTNIQSGGTLMLKNGATMMYAKSVLQYQCVTLCFIAMMILDCLAYRHLGNDCYEVWVGLKHAQKWTQIDTSQLSNDSTLKCSTCSAVRWGDLNVKLLIVFPSVRSLWAVHALWRSLASQVVLLRMRHLCHLVCRIWCYVAHVFE